MVELGVPKTLQRNRSLKSFVLQVARTISRCDDLRLWGSTSLVDQLRKQFMEINLPHLLTRKEVAKLLNVQTQTLAVWASKRTVRLPAHKFGRLVRYKAEDVATFIASNRTSDNSAKDVK